jgi:hypothetical protein
MKKAAWSVCGAGGLVLSACADAQSLPPQIVIRATSALPDSAIEYIADVSVPKSKTIPPGVRPEDVIRSFCGGHLTDTYLRKVVALNDSLVFAPASTVRDLKLPACAKWARNKEVTVGPSDSSLDVLVQRTSGSERGSVLSACEKGGIGARCGATISDLVDRLNAPRQIRIDDLKPGTRIVLPVVTGYTTVTLTDEALRAHGYDTQVVISELNRLVGASAARIGGSGVNSLIDANPAVGMHIIAPVSFSDPTVTKNSCRNASKVAKTWPFDASAVTIALTRSVLAARSREVSLQRTIVRIIDTGFDGVPGAEFPQPLLAQNLQDKRYGISADQGALSPYKEFFPSHGTRVASLVAGGPEFRRLYPELGRLIGLHFSKVANFITEPGSGGGRPNYTYHIDEAFFYNSLIYQPPSPYIVNVSVGSTRDMPVFQHLLASSKELLVVAAAGNTKTNLLSAGWYPANYGGDGILRDQVITVGAHDGFGDRAEFSNFGKTKVDLLAPGCQLVFKNGTATDELFGTSFAAPLVTFTAALLRSLGVARPEEVKTRLFASVDYKLHLRDDAWSSGILNIPKAIHVFHDVVELKNTTMNHGRWIRGSAVTLCKNEEFQSSHVLKVTPLQVANGRMQLRIVYRDANRRIAPPRVCEPLGDGIQFLSEGDAKPSLIRWAEIADLVPSYFPQ